MTLYEYLEAHKRRYTDKVPGKITELEKAEIGTAIADAEDDIGKAEDDIAKTPNDRAQRKLLKSALKLQKARFELNRAVNK